MKTAQLKAVAPASAVARPAMAQRAAFKAAPAPSVARPSFARRVQKLQKAAGVQARNVVVVRAADDKVRPWRPGAPFVGTCAIGAAGSGPGSPPVAPSPAALAAPRRRRRRRRWVPRSPPQQPSSPGPQVVVIGLAADSGCGKSTFMRR